MTRDTNKYHFKVGNFIVHTGITEDVARRESEHQTMFPDGHLKIVGRRVSRESALAWEREQTDQGKPTRGYRSPRLGTRAPRTRL